MCDVIDSLSVWLLYSTLLLLSLIPQIRVHFDNHSCPNSCSFLYFCIKSIVSFTGLHFGNAVLVFSSEETNSTLLLFPYLDLEFVVRHFTEACTPHFHYSSSLASPIPFFAHVTNLLFPQLWFICCIHVLRFHNEYVAERASDLLATAKVIVCD